MCSRDSVAFPNSSNYVKAKGEETAGVWLLAILEEFSRILSLITKPLKFNPFPECWILLKQYVHFRQYSVVAQYERFQLPVVILHN